MTSPKDLSLSGNRFRVIYHLTATRAEAHERAEAIRIEQTVEFPIELVRDKTIREQICGRIESIAALADERWAVIISYADEVAGAELTQLLNVIYGNISLQPGIRVERLELSPSLLACYQGPRFGIPGLRQRSGVTDRPLLCSALKPMGLTVPALADLAYRLALGGMDIIKDDHGLADQPFSPFRERVRACAAAIARANRQTGGHTQYMPNVTAGAGKTLSRAREAQAAGAAGLLICPGLTGWDEMRRIADDDRIALPILSHPALQGSYVVDPRHGISHYVIFGQLNRLAGADAVIFPHFGGRFSFTHGQCRDLVAGATTPMGTLQPVLPVPAGGMNLRRIPEMIRFYGSDCMLLIGGDLHRHGADLVETCRLFKRMVNHP